MISDDEDFSYSIYEKNIEREKIGKETREFLKNGGAVTVIAQKRISIETIREKFRTGKWTIK